jgi:hypothetical protein
LRRQRESSRAATLKEIFNHEGTKGKSKKYRFAENNFVLFFVPWWFEIL